MRNSLKVVIVDYGSGNLHSAKKAFVKALNEISAIGSVLVTNNYKELQTATHIVVPGVGAFADCVAGIRNINQMVAELEQQVLKNKKPFLGICVGMQMLAEKGFENGEHEGLGFIAGDVVKIPSKASLRIPHMGWNNLKIKNNSKLLKGFDENSDVYFVHSYYFKTADANIIATTEYGGEVTAIVEKENIMGVQFHPEKSQQNGIKILSNFLLI